MFKRIRTVALALAVLASFTIASPVAAVYYSICGLANNFHAYLDKSVPNGISDAIGTIYSMEPVHQCTGSTGGSFVLPINLQGNGYCGLQIGYGRAYGDTTDKWRVTGSATDCGFDIPPGWPAPVTNHAYIFRIQHSACAGVGVEAWLYTMTDNASGNSYTFCGGGVTGHLPTEIWSGFEVYRNEDQFGGAGSTNFIRIQDVAYRNGGSYVYVNSSLFTCCGSDTSYWDWYGSTIGGHGAITGYTLNH